MLLYAQPLARIVRLAASDVIRAGDGQLYLRFGTPPTPVPDPFAALIKEQAAASGGDGWLFPGRNVAQPRSYTGVYNALRGAGLPMRNARTSALRDLVVQAPRARRRRRPRLPPDHHHKAVHRCRRPLEPLRRHPKPGRHAPGPTAPEEQPGNVMGALGPVPCWQA